MKIPVSEITEKFKTALATSGATEKDVETMAMFCLEQDWHRNFFSGLDEVKKVHQELRESVGKQHKMIVDKPALKLVDCAGRPAALVSLELVPALCDMARQQGIAIVGFFNGGYQSMPEVFARAIAAEDLVGLLASSAGPQAVVPFGGKKDIMGTNPIAYGIPTNGLPIVFDAATSLYPYGAIRVAREKGEQLPERSFLDKDGNWTTDPNVATATIPFGGHKGYAINLLLEVLCGALVTTKSGLLVKDAHDIGGFLIAIDPAAFGSLEEFKAQTTKLAQDIEAVEPAEGYTEVRVPGYKGERYKQQILKDGEAEVDEATWNRFKAAYKELTGNEA